MTLELLFEALEQGESIGGCTCKAGQDCVVAAKAAHLAGISFHDGLAHGDLTITQDDNFIFGAHGENCRAMPKRGAGSFVICHGR